jgi:predicted nuclease with TOPRIM domain
MLIGIIGIGSVAVVQQMNYQNLDAQYQSLLSEYGILDTVYEQAIEDYETIYDQYQSKVAEYDQLNDTYTSLLSTHDSLLDVYGTMADELLSTISELIELNTTYVNLMAEFEDLNITYYILTGDYDALNASYVLLTQQYDDLNTTYWSLLDSYEILQLEIDALSASYDQLLAEHNLLQVEYDALLFDFDVLSITYNTLLGDYATLQSDHEALQSDYNNLWLNYNTLWAAHQALQNDYDALQASYVTLQSQYNQLQTDYNSLEQDYLNLQTEYDTLSTSYLILQGEYDACVIELTQLQADYDVLNVQYWALDASYIQLQADYDALELSYNTLTTWIRQQILPIQSSIFAEAVRRYYFEDFYVQDKWATGNHSGYWSEFARFCRDVVLHDSLTYFGSGDKTVVLDYSHGQYSSYVELMDEWLEGNLSALGFTNIIWAYGGLNSSVLAGADALILGAILGDNGFTAAEVTAVGDWFNAGHKFLWVGGDSDYNGPNIGNNMTLILEEVGSHVYHEPTAIEDPISNAGGSGYRVVANGTSDDAFVASIVAGVDAVLMHGPTMLYGSNSDTPGENVNPVALETVSIDNVYPLLYYGAAATITDGDITYPYAHTDGQVGAFVATTLEVKAGADGTGVIVVSGASPYGDYSPMYNDEYYGVPLNGYRLVNQAIYFGTLKATASLEGSWFPDVSNALADCLHYGNRTELLALASMYLTFYPWLPNWAGWALSGDPLNDISSVIQWCVDEIDYEYDSDITRLRTPYGWDYIKFPVETAFRTMGYDLVGS